MLGVVRGTPGGIRTHDRRLRRTAGKTAAFERRQTCNGFEADLQAVAPFLEQWHGNSTLFRGEFRLRQCQKLTGHGLECGSPIGGPLLLATTQARPICNRGHGPAFTIELQRKYLSWCQDRRCRIHGLVQQHSDRMTVGEGTASVALVRQAFHAWEANKCRVEQAIAVGLVAQGVVDPPEVRCERPTAAARRTCPCLAIGIVAAWGVRRLQWKEHYGFRLSMQGRGCECRIP